ncbi:MAG: helix-hairpin-helix domain-containing protein, partial [Microvirga sp.]
AQFYDDKPAPRLILVSHEIEDCELLAAALSTRAEARVEIHVAKRGERRNLVAYALRNAREALARRLADTASQQKLLTSLGQAFGLAKPPRRIDVFDNSHIMGTNAVGAMIVAGPAGLMKQHYRTFNIKSEELSAGDDYGMMREVLRRRFSRLVKEAPRGENPSPVQPAEAGNSQALAETGAFPSPLRGGAGVGGDGPDPDLTVPSPAADAVRLPSTESPVPAPPPPLGLRPSRPSPQGGGESAPQRKGAVQWGGEHDADAFPAWPDLVLIDGGKGQLEAAQAALAEVGVDGVALVGIAKGRDRDAGRETFFLPGKPPLKLPPRDPALYFVQRLRDEAHRFAIGAHRAKRKREMAKGPLDEIPGIGPNRKRALLHHFGTVKAIERASYEDLVKTAGVNAATARAVYDFFHAGRG